ncbi:MAG TPA: type I 3-dehydroquinate dehydratase [Desulfitobacteriaceae bacterium]|nr:type I 3-dehydroquinate dehydratase [Desulfitobacteriaceae bacterium]
MKGGQPPLICTPLIGQDQTMILAELNNILPKKPDLIEWRADFFTSLADKGEVLATAAAIRKKIADTPLLLTIRSSREGGQPLALDQAQVVEVYAEACRSPYIDLIDFELSNPAEELHYLQKTAAATATKLILSYHNFESTPAPDVIRAKFEQAERLGADVAKVAVMPGGLEDVLTLLSLTLEARKYLRIPVISIAMGEYGSLTRMFGWVFGSVVTFAVGAMSSAPGQVPIEDLQLVLALVQKGLGLS